MECQSDLPAGPGHLELAIYEILYVDDVPTSVAVSEAMVLTKKYESEETAAFVNGILGSFVRGELPS